MWKLLVAAMPLASMWKKLSAEQLVYKPTKLKSDPGIEGMSNVNGVTNAEWRNADE